MTSILAPDPAFDEPADTTQAVVDAARALARRMKHTPNWEERLLPQARALVEAVDAHDQAATS